MSGTRSKRRNREDTLWIKLAKDRVPWRACVDATKKIKRTVVIHTDENPYASNKMEQLRSDFHYIFYSFLIRC